MKNIKIYGLLACLCLLMQSCLFSEDDVFDDSSAQRAMASVEECHNMLLSAPNGWLMEYYPGDGPEFGGYNLIAKFDGDYVELASELSTGNYRSGEICKSLYKLESFQGTELSFDSHNELIHMFCEPSGYNAPGYAGDYEFTFRSVTKDKIELTGKKRGNKLIMTPLPENTDWQVYLSNVNSIKNSAAFETYKLMVGGDEVVRMIQYDHALTVRRLDENGQAITTRYPFIYTETGIKMLDPLKVNGKTMSNFTWDVENRSFVCSDNGVDASFDFFRPDKYYDYIGRFRLMYGNSQTNVTISEKVDGASYVMKGLTSFDIEIRYNFDNDCIDIFSQYLGSVLGMHLYLCAWDAVGGSLTWVEGSGLTGFVTSGSSEPTTIEFKDNGVFGTADSILLYLFLGTASVETALMPLQQLPFPVLQKIGD